jgi:hypothetical protein
MSRYKLIPRLVTNENGTTHREIGDSRTLAIANPEDRPDDSYRGHDVRRTAIHVGPEESGRWVLVYRASYVSESDACEIAVDFAVDRWPGYDRTPSTADIDAEIIDRHRDRLKREDIDSASMSDAEILAAYPVTNETSWEIQDALTQGCDSDGCGRYAQVNVVMCDITSREDLIAFLYPDGPRTKWQSKYPDEHVTDRHAAAVNAMCEAFMRLGGWVLATI